MISDLSLEYSDQWACYVGPGIGNSPDSYSVTPAVPPSPGNPGSLDMQFSTSGKPYTNVMAAVHRSPLQVAFKQSSVRYSFSFDLTTDGNVQDMQVHESEARLYYIGPDGVCRTFNNSLQLNQVNPAGMIQAYAPPPNNVWTDTGIVIPKLSPNTKYSIEIDYLADMINNLFSTLSITINTQQYKLPALFQKIPALVQSPAWDPGVYTQFQLGLASKGGSMTEKYRNVKINWK